MLKIYQLQNGGLKGAVIAEGDTIPAASLWLDLFNPTLEERRAVDRLMEMELPTRADMEEIEISSRLYQEDGGTFMTALIMSNSDSDNPTMDVVTFVLARERLITIRYIDPQPFQTYAARCERTTVPVTKAESILMGLLDVIIDRMADVLERTGAEVESTSQEIFAPEAERPTGARDFQAILRRLGRKHGITSKMRESLLSIGRVLTFMTQATEGKAAKDVRTHLKTLSRDVQSLQDHSSFIASKLAYLQDGTLGLINNEQNNIIKIMSVAAMVFLPPTLFASIWGMNFTFMPELHWHIGYPIAFVVMVVSGVVPYFWFKRRGWL
ncbi:MAG: magnesium transporter CorA family protein [Proteobacteria bacterium]|nr:magnesium transporter CorA family protein [Pseudomonadota bacterium]